MTARWCINVLSDNFVVTVTMTRRCEGLDRYESNPAIVLARRQDLSSLSTEIYKLGQEDSISVSSTSRTDRNHLPSSDVSAVGKFITFMNQQPHG